MWAHETESAPPIVAGFAILVSALILLFAWLFVRWCWRDWPFR